VPDAVVLNLLLPVWFPMLTFGHHSGSPSPGFFIPAWFLLATWSALAPSGPSIHSVPLPFLCSLEQRQSSHPFTHFWSVSHYSLPFLFHPSVEFGAGCAARKHPAKASHFTGGDWKASTERMKSRWNMELVTKAEEESGTPHQEVNTRCSYPSSSKTTAQQDW
jgi:hypothetical protein